MNRAPILPGSGDPAGPSRLNAAGLREVYTDMTTQVKAATTLVSFLATALLVAPEAHAQSVKIGVFDPVRILSDSTIGQRLEEEVNRIRVSRERELKSAREAFERKVEQYQSSVQTMSPERREEVETDLEKQRRDLKRQLDDSDAELRRRLERGKRDLERSLSKVLEDYGRQKNFTLILQRDLVAFSPSSVDITDDLITLVNAEAAKKS
ncbi:MAG: OmpH family outer membrane protein [Acidobacteriota bacterium]